MSDHHHDRGFDLARDAVAAATAREPGHARVLFPVGAAATVMDVKALSGAYAMALDGTARRGWAVEITNLALQSSWSVLHQFPTVYTDPIRLFISV